MDRQLKIITLRFLDEFGLLRVGGRLQKANWSYSQKHPCILPGNDKFSELLIQRAHRDVIRAYKLLLISSEKIIGFFERDK